MGVCKVRVTTSLFASLGLVTLITSPLGAQDPVKVAAGTYVVFAENDQVRILDVKLAPGQKTAMHSHPDLVAVILDPGRTKWTLKDGTSHQSDPGAKRGTAGFMNAETHVSENVGKTPLHAILVEFKKPAPAAGMGTNVSLPPPFKLVAENPHARVYEERSGPGAKISQHTHTYHVTISLTDAIAEVTDKDGRKETQSFQKDVALWGIPGTHSAVNTGKTPSHIIDIEVK